MKKHLKGFVAGVVFATMINSIVFAGGLLETIDVLWNNVKIEVLGERTEMNNLLYNGTTYVPIREISKAFGKKVEWDRDSNTAKIVQIDISNKAEVEELYADIINQGKRELDVVSEELANIQSDDEVERVLQHFKAMSKLDIQNVYFGKQDSGKMYVQPKVEFPEGYDPRQRPWYADRDTDYYIADIYTDIINEAQILIMSKPVIKNGTFIGAIGIDINLGIE